MIRTVSIQHDIARLEAKVDAALAQGTIDRQTIQSHIAECNVRNKQADDNEKRSREEWENFILESRTDRQRLADKIGSTEKRLALLMGAIAGLGWLAEHFHIFH